MDFMTCNSCRRVVQINNTGICLGCQRGFTGLDAEDVYKTDEQKIHELKSREKELIDALDKSKKKTKQ